MIMGTRSRIRTRIYMRTMLNMRMMIKFRSKVMTMIEKKKRLWFSTTYQL